MSAVLKLSELERQRVQPTGSAAELWKKIEAYPTLHTASLSRVGAGGLQRSSNFERGLRLLMTGLRLRHAELTAERKAAEPPARRKAAP